ncbi:hypothetical protein AAFX91_14140 [Bradyrhizobium sp. 31Argb]|uniref:hypothetical protein n=1 Tax=Bradyrhizobium sp. 31Argb TaxID=3141247 RepID=UPI003747AAD9
MVGSEDDIILDCYRLARWYHVSPELFLSMPLNDVATHMRRTAQLDREQQAAKGEDE